jgi:hypothetical protein
MITPYPSIFPPRRLVRFLSATGEQISEGSVQYKITRSAINAWHMRISHPTQWGTNINLHNALFLRSGSVHTGAKVDGVPHTHCKLLCQYCVLDTQNPSSTWYRGVQNFRKIWEPPQNCMRQRDEQNKFHTENSQQLHKPSSWKLADHVSRTRAALMSFVQIPGLAGLFAHTTPTGWSLHITRPV